MLAVSLSRRDFREFDQIVSFYTEEFGKTKLLARGIKKITSRNAAQVEPFSFVDIEIARGKEIDHLTKVQGVDFFPSIRRDLKKTLLASASVGLVDELVEAGESDRRIYETLLEWLNFVDAAGFVNIMLMDWFALKLLNYLGFAPTADDKMNTQDMNCLLSGDLQKINNMEDNNTLHQMTLDFLRFHSERNIADWGRHISI